MGGRTPACDARSANGRASERTSEGNALNEVLARPISMNSAMGHACDVPRPPRRRGLGAAILAVLLSVVPPGAPAEERQRPSFGALEARTLKLVNGHRRSARLPSLDHSRPIAAIARRHSEAMAAGRVPFGHEGFERRRREIARSVALGGMAENVGVNTAPAQKTAAMTVSGWLSSAGHRRNIEGDYDVTGIGIARGPRGAWYYTQIFVKRQRRPPVEKRRRRQTVTGSPREKEGETGTSASHSPGGSPSSRRFGPTRSPCRSSRRGRDASPRRGRC